MLQNEVYIAEHQNTLPGAPQLYYSGTPILRPAQAAVLTEGWSLIRESIL